jgi:heme oxygenase (biliverdin-producing, ferredoxin)
MYFYSLSFSNGLIVILVLLSLLYIESIATSTMKTILRTATPLSLFLSASTDLRVASFTIQPLVGRGFTPERSRQQHDSDAAFEFPSRSTVAVAMMATTTSSVETAGNFIESELRGAAMKLHTRSQAPKEGQAEEKNMEPYVTTHADYLQFLVDSQHVYQAMEDVVDSVEELTVFRNTGLERVQPLEKDIDFMVQEYGLQRPPVGQPGLQYAQVIRNFRGKPDLIPEFLCHYYNFYFAHTAGGRMIGKQMAALLLDKKTLEFYKWDGDLNQIKPQVKNDIEAMVAMWSRFEKDRCVGETANAFQGGGAINSHLSGGQSPN